MAAEMVFPMPIILVCIILQVGKFDFRVECGPSAPSEAALRIFNAYGPRSRTTGAYGAVIGVLRRQLIAKKPFTVVGNGKQKRDFLFVSDLAEAFFKAAVTKKSGKIWNLGSSSPQSINKLCRILGSKLTFFDICNNFIKLFWSRSLVEKPKS